MIAAVPITFAQILTVLRSLMTTNGISAYIVPSGDEHYTEFVAECHQRRAFISGFTGSQGTAIVTQDYALLWTDGRYYFQAENELFTGWDLMKDGAQGTPTQAQWLIGNLTTGQNVGVDPSLYTKGQWDGMESQLKAGGLSLTPVEENLIDLFWFDQPACGKEPIINLNITFSGKETSVKVAEVRKEMVDNDASVLLITELDEVAWLLNLRGRDIPSSSTFFSYVVLTNNTLDFYVNPAQVPQEVLTVLQAQVPAIQVRPYESVYEGLNETLSNRPEGKVWANRNANSKLIRIVTNPDRLLVKLTPVSLMKSLKNQVEVDGYRRCLLRDAAALCEFFSWLEAAVEGGVENVTETSAATVLYNIRQSRSELFFDKSFDTISATGLNAAIIHYMPTEASSQPLKRDELYLCDSGGLYYDGTTDITRTIAFSEPTPFQKEAYTRVLKGHIALATAKFPFKTVGQRLDSFAREHLWEVGLEYNHGTGHGIGSFLNVHEGPQRIGSGYSQDDPGLQENMFTSNEPGYYDEINEFGIRLENIIRVMSVDLEHNFGGLGFLGFEDMTLLPYDHKLIDASILTQTEIDYLNHYHQETREKVGQYLLDNNFPQSAYNWMYRDTRPIGAEPSDPPSTTTPDPSISTTTTTTTTTPNPQSSSTHSSGSKMTVYSSFFFFLSCFVAFMRLV